MRWGDPRSYAWMAMSVLLSSCGGQAEESVFEAEMEGPPTNVDGIGGSPPETGGNLGTGPTTGVEPSAGGGGVVVSGTGGLVSSAGSGGQWTGGSSGGGTGGSSGGSPPAFECTLESATVELTGGLELIRTAQGDDSCGLVHGSSDGTVATSLFLYPPEVENQLLLSMIVRGLTVGTTGPMSIQTVSILTTGAIWNNDLPEPGATDCSLDVMTFEEVGQGRRLVGAVTCDQALQGIGELGEIPLTVSEWTFSMVTQPVSP